MARAEGAVKAELAIGPEGQYLAREEPVSNHDGEGETARPSAPHFRWEHRTVVPCWVDTLSACPWM